MKFNRKLFVYSSLCILYSFTGFGKSTEVVTLFQGASYLLDQKATRFSEATEKNSKKARKIVDEFQEFRLEQKGNSYFKLVEKGRSYQSFSPIQPSISLYVSHCQDFLDKTKEKKLKTFGFKGDIGEINKCPFVSFSKSTKTAVKYGFGVADPNFDTANIEFPYYDEKCSPSIGHIGEIMIAFPETSRIKRQKDILCADIVKETRDKKIYLGQTQERRLGQEEVCVMSWIPDNVKTEIISIQLPDFYEEWKYDGIDVYHRKVNEFGVTQREYKARKRMVESADDTNKSRKEICKKMCKYGEKNMDYIIGKSIKTNKKKYCYTIKEDFSYPSILNKKQ